MNRAVSLPQDKRAALEFVSVRVIRVTRVPQTHIGERVIAHRCRRVSAQVLVRQKQNLDGLAIRARLSATRQCPFQNSIRIAGCTNRATMLAAERFDRRGAIHVANRNHAHVHVAIRVGQCFPTIDRLIVVRHISHRTARAHVGQDHDGALGGENVCGLRHEMHAEKDDIFRAGFAHLLSGKLGELETIAREVSELDNAVLLIVMPKNDDLITKFFTSSIDSADELGLGHARVFIRKWGLPEHGCNYSGGVGGVGQVGVEGLRSIKRTMRQ